MTEAKFKETVVEYLEAVRQSGKSETSGLVTAIYKTLDDLLSAQRRLREKVYLALIGVLICIYALSFIYVFNTQVNQQNLDESVAAAMEHYLELEGYVVE